jgi:hypothetical protein
MWLIKKMASKVEIKTIEELNKMHTGSLMNRRKALLKCEESFKVSDRNGCEKKPLASETGVIEFKDTPEWKQAYEELKIILSTRENLPNKEERKVIRREKAKSEK